MVRQLVIGRDVVDTRSRPAESSSKSRLSTSLRTEEANHLAHRSPLWLPPSRSIWAWGWSTGPAKEGPAQGDLLVDAVPLGVLA